jgi:hypothetical protein
MEGSAAKWILSFSPNQILYQITKTEYFLDVLKRTFLLEMMNALSYSRQHLGG